MAIHPIQILSDLWPWCRKVVQLVLVSHHSDSYQRCVSWTPMSRGSNSTKENHTLALRLPFEDSVRCWKSQVYELV